MMNDAARERWAAIRLAYEAGSASVADICREFEIGKPTLYSKVHAQGWRMRELPANFARRGQTTHPAAKQAKANKKSLGATADAADRRKLIQQLYDSLARQMH